MKTFDEYLNNHINESDEYWFKSKALQRYNPNLIEYIRDIDEKTDLEIQNLKKKCNDKKEEIRKFLVGKQLKIVGNTNIDSEIKEYNLYIDNNDLLYFGGTNKLVWKLNKNVFIKTNPHALISGSFDERLFIFIEKILNIDEYKKMKNINDPYAEEIWDID